MTESSWIARLVQQEDINFLLTNRIPRNLLTRLMGRISRIENPWLCRAGIAAWRLFTDLDLSEARQNRFKSIHDCFTRELKDGARSIDRDPAVLASPCDAIVGANGRVTEGMVLQAKGFPYPLGDLLGDAEAVRRHQGCAYVTLRLTSSMYHRFHAPADCVVERVDYVAGDTWNVNPIALKRIERLFCKNERAIIRCRLGPADERLTLVPVAAILVASIRLHCIDPLLSMRYRGPARFDCAVPYARGAEMGWFEHGSTIIVFAPPRHELSGGLREGSRIRMGEALLRRIPPG
jgi:phosphatidylserine decarboxylase